jgi:hypothetical protein
MLGEHAQALTFGVVREHADERILVTRDAEGAGLRAGALVRFALHQRLGALQLRRERGSAWLRHASAIGADRACLRGRTT